ncbi:MAG: FadR/GntR family transcriptional regulator [Paenibacillaceae bacterium]
MEFTRIQHRKIHEEIAEQMKNQIITGKLIPGQKLPSTRELSEMYQVGMSTIREALSGLKAMGLVESHQGEGSYVKSIGSASMEMPSLESLLMNRETILELLEARKALEVANAGLAAEKRNEQNLVDLEQILNRMKSNLGNEAEGEKADLLFHQTLADSTHNSIMVRLLDTIASQMETVIRETRRLQMYSSASESEQLWREHCVIFNAIKAGEPSEAQAAMITHLQHVENILFRYLK